MKVLKGIQRVAVCDLFCFFPKNLLNTFKLSYMKIWYTLSVNTRKIRLLDAYAKIYLFSEKYISFMVTSLYQYSSAF